MGMTTDDPKKYRVNLRINEEMNRKLIEESQRKGQTIAEYVRGLISSFSLADTEAELLKDIFNMAKLSGVDQEKFLRILDKELTQGTLVIENGRIRKGEKNT